MKIYNRYRLLFAFIIYFLFASFLIRTTLLVLSFSKAQLGFMDLVSIYGVGLFYDLGVALFFSVLYAIYLLLLPQKFNNSRINRIITYSFFFIVILITVFSFFAEIVFWQEFESRFNFIAVDYLVYTYEVINNINESYPLPWLIGFMLILCIFLLMAFTKAGIFAQTFHSVTRFKPRLMYSGIILLLAFTYALFVKNSWTENGEGRYANELKKAGIFSFFAAFKNNELSYQKFYTQIPLEEAFQLVKHHLNGSDIHFNAAPNTIERFIKDSATAVKPNVIMVTIESFSAEFMAAFGNTKGITPVLDSLAKHSLLFTNMYATGTRTVRGMEALSLAIPPTPGNSIVRRPQNANLLTIGNIFSKAGYSTNFLYGGDGYFDNMNNYFGNNGYDVTDRGRNILGEEAFASKRSIIPDSLVNFENAWGICDEDLYDAVIRNADEAFGNGKSFYDFVMTTSNHRPYTFPAGKISLPSGSGRDAAVRYTDYAIGAFLQKAKQKPWYTNTIFIFVADHCASSAGKNEIDISKYLIPCIVFNPAQPAPEQLTKQCSQIDLYPTLFARLHWSYSSNLFGEDVASNSYSPRALLGTYQKLAYLKNDSLVILSPQQKTATYHYNITSNEQQPVTPDNKLVNEAIAQYQVAYYLYKNNGLKQAKN